MDFSLIGANIVKLITTYWKVFLIDGVTKTLQFTCIAVVLGAILGTFVAMLKMSKLGIVRFLASVYIEVIRGTPILLQLYVFYFVLPEILPFLGIEPDYSAEELVGADAPVPNVVGMNKMDAVAKLEGAGFAFKAVGNGETVTDQTPVGGAIVPNNATVILYMGEKKPSALCAVPNVMGKTAAESNQILTNAGLIMKVAGATSSSSGNVRAISQSYPEGERLAAGTVVTVQFGDSTVLD